MRLQFCDQYETERLHKLDTNEKESLFRSTILKLAPVDFSIGNSREPRVIPPSMHKFKPVVCEIHFRKLYNRHLTLRDNNRP